MSQTPPEPRSPNADPARGAAFEALRGRIESREAVVAVVGLGYVGLPLLHAVSRPAAARDGFPTIGLDHDGAKIESLRRGENYLPHLGHSMAAELSGCDHVTLTSDPSALAGADAVLICVPTPLDEKHEPDLGAIRRAGREIAEHALSAGRTRPLLVVLESTTYPGTTRDVLGAALREGAAGSGAVFLAFSPEREDPGNPDFETRTIPKLVGGTDADSGTLARLLYQRIVHTVVPVSSAEVAEAAKLVENIYRAVNIALVNELKIALSAMGLDIWEVLDAAATKPFGFQRFNPGPGFGGHCVPVDPFYLAWKARQVGTRADFIELAGHVNRRMPGFVVDQCEAALREDGRPIAGAKVLVLGLAYKPNIGDVRESPSFELIDQLQERGAAVSYHDPYVPRTWRGRRHDLAMSSVQWTSEDLSTYDLILISTDHDWYDWAFVARHARLVVDTRNAIARAGVSGGARVVKA